MMLTIEGKSVLPIHTAILCEQEEVNIHQNRLIQIALVHTHVDIEYAKYFSVSSANALVFADK